MTTAITQTGKQQSVITVWDPAVGYEGNDIVVKDNAMWVANGNITAGSWQIGTTGGTWSRVVDGFDPQREIKIPWAGSYFARVHSCGVQVYRAGSFNTRIGGLELGSNPAGSYELPFLDYSPPQWKKIGTTVGNFYGLGTDGVMYVAGINNLGQLGMSGGTQPYIVRQTHPSIFGPGITVLDFWSMANDENPNNGDGNCIVLVDDNGVLKTYGWGVNTLGQLGIGSTVNQFAPAEIVNLRDKRIISVSSWTTMTMVVTDGGEVWGAGRNNNGQLGIGSTASPTTTMTRARRSATQFVTGARDVQIMLRRGIGWTTYVLLADGGVLSVGLGNDGVLGDGNASAHQTTFFGVVTTYPSLVPMANIVRIQAACTSLLALDTDGNVWAVGVNLDLHWGRGVTGEIAAQGIVVAAGVANMWNTTGPDGYASAFYHFLDGTVLAAGSNADYQLGVVDAGEISDVFSQKVALPEGEYPVALVRTGAVTDRPYLGHFCVTNKNRLYAWGLPGADVFPQATDVGVDFVARWPVRINDFYQPHQS